MAERAPQNIKVLPSVLGFTEAHFRSLMTPTAFAKEACISVEEARQSLPCYFVHLPERGQVVQRFDHVEMFHAGCAWHGYDIAFATLLPMPERKAAKRRPREGVPPKLRWAVFARDGHCCVYCGANGEGVRLQVDHRVPLSAGGRTAIDNLVTACSTCNAGKSDQLLPEPVEGAE